MTLSEYISTTNSSADAIAAAIGCVSASGVRKWITGERQPDADMIEKIIALTNGAVTESDMHSVRLAWLKEHRPEKFAEARSKNCTSEAA